MMAKTSLEIFRGDQVEVHGKPTSVNWLVKTVLKWFGPFETRVDTGVRCTQFNIERDEEGEILSMKQCNGRLQNVYPLIEIRGVGFKKVFANTNSGLRVGTVRYVSCNLPSCHSWGEHVLVSIEDDKKLKKAYRNQTSTWKYGRKKR